MELFNIQLSSLGVATEKERDRINLEVLCGHQIAVPSLALFLCLKTIKLDSQLVCLTKNGHPNFYQKASNILVAWMLGKKAEAVYSSSQVNDSQVVKSIRLMVHRV